MKNRALDSDGNEKKGSRDLTPYRGALHTMEVLIPNHGTEIPYALGNKNNVNFTGIFRKRSGRMRILWIANEETREAIVLFMSSRQAGGRKDIYFVFERLLRSGEFDACFEALGLPNPLSL